MKLTARGDVVPSAEQIFRVCDVTDEGLVILEPARLADQPMDRRSYDSAYAELRQRLGRNGALLVLAPLARLTSDAEEGSPQ
jgi:hypothetical protein